MVAAGMRETIVATASPPGRGVRSIVRASGPGVAAIVEHVLGGEPSGRGVSCVRARIGSPSAVVSLVAARSIAGASFTGEDSIEVSLVSSPPLVEAVGAAFIAAVREAGLPARPAQRGEFAYRAFRAGTITLEAAEAMAARIAATADAELAAAGALAGGVYARNAEAISVEVASLLALVEAGIDFSDEEGVVAIGPADLSSKAQGLAVRCRALRGAESSSRSSACPRIVLAGAPNAGKSSLFNALLGRRRTVASPEAGTTRDAIVERLPLGDGLEVELVDLAGVSSVCPEPAAHGSIGSSMDAVARRMTAGADIVVHCTPVDRPRAALGTTGIGGEVIEVATQCDRAHPPVDRVAIATSAATGEGVEALRRALAARVRADRAHRAAALSSILPRHDACLADAAEALEEVVRETARGHADAELVASLLRAALDRLGEVSGAVHPDDVLGLVFSRFCIGK